MTRTEFMAALRSRLSHLPAEEQDAALRYYEEYFDEADSEEEAARQLGSPEDIAARILGEGAQAQAEQPQTAQQPVQPPKPKHSPWFWAGIVTLCIFASPVLLGVAAAALGLPTIPGTELLLYQAVGAFSLFTGCAPDVPALREMLGDALK